MLEVTELVVLLLDLSVDPELRFVLELCCSEFGRFCFGLLCNVGLNTSLLAKDLIEVLCEDEVEKLLLRSSSYW